MDGRFTLHCGNSLEVLATLPENSVDAVVCDPPYELGFMGKGWDKSGIANNPDLWAAVLRVLKPGGHLLAFSGSRTYHRMTCAIEDAGFEVRDQIMWLYGSGFPKSHDVSKGIDKAAGVEFDAVPASGVGFMNAEGAGGYNVTKNQLVRKGEATDAARQWQGWGTALKPAHEPICVARKPLRGTVAENVLAHGTGAINVDGCRVGTDGGTAKGSKPQGDGNGIYGAGLHGNCEIVELNAGRWPANIIHDGSDEVVAGFPNDGDDTAARFFYCAKASKEDRDDGLQGVVQGVGALRDGGRESMPRRNHHPTVKPTDLMRYLCRLVTPPGGVVLDPFMGSGSTGKAAMLEGFRFIGIDLTPEYVEIARARIQHAHDTRHDIPALMRKESKASGQLSIFDTLATAELPQAGTK